MSDRDPADRATGETPETSRGTSGEPSESADSEPLEKQIEAARRRGEDETALLKRLVFRVIDEVRAGLDEEAETSEGTKRVDGTGGGRP